MTTCTSGLCALIVDCSTALKPAAPSESEAAKLALVHDLQLLLRLVLLLRAAVHLGVHARDGLVLQDDVARRGRRVAGLAPDARDGGAAVGAGAERVGLQLGVRRRGRYALLGEQPHVMLARVLGALRAPTFQTNKK